MIDIAFPRAYDRILNIWSEDMPRVAARARASLDVLLHALISSPDPNALASSTLTLTGSPFEPAFSFAAPGVRYTVDPTPPAIAPLDRLEYVLYVLNRLQAPDPPSSWMRRLAPLQAMGPLRFGAHIGARHEASSDAYKLYIEVPVEAQELADSFAQELLGSPPVLNVPDRHARPAIFGIDLTLGTLEVYYRIENLHPCEIATLMARIHAAERASEILAMLNETQPRAVRHSLPGSTWGFSYALHSDESITFSIYTFARTLFGPDGWIRNAVLSMGERHGWDLAAYAKMSEPLRGSHRGACHHGIFGLILPQGKPLAPWIGLAPPEPNS